MNLSTLPTLKNYQLLASLIDIPNHSPHQRLYKQILGILLGHP